MVDSNSGGEEEDNDAAYIDNRRGAPNHERSRNDTIPEEPTISLEDLNSQANDGPHGSLNSGFVPEVRDAVPKKAFYGTQEQRDARGKETKLIDSQTLSNEQQRAEGQKANAPKQLQTNNSLSGLQRRREIKLQG